MLFCWVEKKLLDENIVRETAIKFSSISPRYPRCLRFLKWLVDFNGLSGMFITLLGIAYWGYLLSLIYIFLFHISDFKHFFLVGVGVSLWFVAYKVWKRLEKFVFKWSNQINQQFQIQQAMVQKYLSSDLIQKLETGLIDLESAIEIAILRDDTLWIQEVSCSLEKIMHSLENKLRLRMIDKDSYNEIKQLYKKFQPISAHQ